ncbi:TPA: restriction endonuclease subunit S [Klebsiella quasipneumoniae subsp. similipneumoniae]|nr:restriction endonuclease subunit S [Klebsiella quasipneumoniae subsp. similipneumoniae]
MAKYKAYPEYKDSGVEWLGELPEHWTTLAIKHVAQLNPSKSCISIEKMKGMCSFIPMEKLKFNSLSLDEIKYVPDVYNGYTYFENEDILIAKVTPCFENKNMVVAHDLHNGIGFGSSEIYVLRCNDIIKNDFLFYRLQEDNFMFIAEGAMTGAGGLKRVPSEVLNNFKFGLPSKKEQSIIVAFLDHETAKIDNLIEKQQQLIELLKEKRQAVISHAVTKGLNPDVPMKDSGVEWLGEVPAHWDVLRLKHLISSLESGCSVNAADIPAQQGEVAVLKTSCVYTRSFRANENKTVVSEDLHRIKCPVRKGSIIISRMNTPDLVGASALVDVDAENIYLPDRLWQTNFNPKFKLIPGYLAHFMTIQGFRTQISLGAEGASSSMQNIAKDDYLSINCLLPSIEEQQEITFFLEEKLSYFSGLELRSSEIIQLLQERRTALISAAVTGKIDVRDWVAPDSQDIEASQEATA